MTVMKGDALFAHFENPFSHTRRALHESIETVILAEQLGFLPASHDSKRSRRSLSLLANRFTCPLQH